MKSTQLTEGTYALTHVTVLTAARVATHMSHTLRKNIYEKYSGEEGASGDEDGCHAEYCSMMNEISIYYPNMKSKKMIVETLIHEYIHYLQSPTWFKRYYDMGHDYVTHPYEIEATSYEKDYKLFI